MSFESERTRWEDETLRSMTDRLPERKPEFQTSSGIPLPRVLTPPDDDPDYTEKLGFPGGYPFTRGVHPSMYRGCLWAMRQYARYASAKESDARGDANLVPLFIECVENDITLGEICSLLRKVWGEYEPSVF